MTDKKEYTEKQISRLKDLLATSQKALQLSNNYQEQANTLYQTCKANCIKLNTAHAKLDLINGQLTKQIQLIGHLMSQLRARNNNLISSLEKLHNSDQEVIKDIADVFQKLKEKNVDNKIAPDKNLYDFVDTDAVEALKNQALQEMKELKNIQVHSEQLVTSIERKFERLSHMSKDPLLQVEYKPSYVSEKMNLQANEINSISSIIVSVATQHDRLNHLYHNRNNFLADLTTIEKRTENELPTQVSKIYDCLQRIKNVAAEVDLRIQKHSSVFHNSINLLAELEKFGLETKSELIELDALEVNFEERREGARYLFEELSNLVTWYELFYTAYDELVFEIIRRQKEQQRQQEIIESYQRELNLVYSMESQKRDHFFEFYGRYLPQSLCPPIMDPAPRYQITPDYPPNDLPNIAEIERPSKSQVDLALSQMDFSSSDPSHITGSVGR